MNQVIVEFTGEELIHVLVHDYSEAFTIAKGGVRQIGRFNDFIFTETLDSIGHEHYLVYMEGDDLESSEPFLEFQLKEFYKLLTLALREEDEEQLANWLVRVYVIALSKHLIGKKQISDRLD